MARTSRKAHSRPKTARTGKRRRNEAAAEEEIIVPSLLSSEPGPVANPPKCNPPAEATLFWPVDADAWNRYRRTRYASNPPEEVATLTYPVLAAEIGNVRDRINVARGELKKYLVDKDEIIDLMFTCCAAAEPFLMVGPPGTGKSDLTTKFCDVLGLGNDEYFEYVLTKFTEPSELFGPVDMNQLREGRYVRRTQGKLPEAKVAFLDEVFRGNSAILNTLLTLMNERKFYQDGKAVPVKLSMLFGATNKIPEFEELGAIRDRFTLKVESGPVKDDRFDELLERGLSGELDKALGRKPWANLCKLDDFLKVKRYMDLTMAGYDRSGTRTGTDPIATDRKHYFPEPIYAAFKDVISALEREAKVYVSDRKVIRLYKLIRTRAFLFHGGVVTAEDVQQIMRHVGDRSEDLAVVREKVDNYMRVAKGER